MNIQIAKPCGENWENMKPTDNYRFCEVCQSRVSDFTGATAEEIMQQYQLNKGHLCGRVSGALLREQWQELHIKRNYWYELKVFCWALLLSFGSSLFFIPHAQANVVLEEGRRVFKNTEKDSLKEHEVVIKGLVRDKETTELLPFVSIAACIHDTVVVAKAFTNLDGYYEMKLDAEKYKNVTLKAVYVGYQTVIIHEVSLKKETEININFQSMEIEMMGLIITEQPLPNLIDPFQSGKTIRSDEYRRMPKD